LRTRSTFEVAVKELGGEVLNLSTEFAGGREPLEDVARNLERWVRVLVIRTFAQERARLLANAAPRLSVINALTDEQHPCQALADAMRLVEQWGDCRGRRIAFRRRRQQRRDIARACDEHAWRHPAHRVARGLRSPRQVVAEAAARRARRRRVVRHRDPRDAVPARDAVYTDVWASMGEEHETAGAKTAVHALSGGRCADGGRPRRMPCSCTAFRRTGAREVTGRGLRIAQVSGLRPGGKPAARAEGRFC
jgi:ornithine carbamoyltransferase